jgi:hypothetical protein
MSKEKGTDEPGIEGAREDKKLVLPYSMFSLKQILRHEFEGIYLSFI